MCETGFPLNSGENNSNRKLTFRWFSANNLKIHQKRREKILSWIWDGKSSGKVLSWIWVWRSQAREYHLFSKLTTTKQANNEV